MARNVFISFRYRDGHEYKEELANLFDRSIDTVDFSEDQNRSLMSEDTIQRYLYGKLRRSSVTIALLTPEAIEYRKDWYGRYDDWIYDEVRYSLENRGGNATNGLVAVYVPEAKPLLINEVQHFCDVCRQHSIVQSLIQHDNLVYRNMLNVKSDYKIHKCPSVFDGDYDSYCSLIEYNDFKSNFGKYIDISFQKRSELYKYNLCKRL